MDLAPGELLIVRCTDGVARLHAGVLDEHARRAYQLGQCHALSIALHERTGWPIEVVLARRSRRDRVDWASALADASKRLDVLRTRWVHTVVRRRDGFVVDITGACDESAMMQRWSPQQTPDAVRLVPVSAETLVGLAHRGSGVEVDLDAARSFVDAVVALSDSTCPLPPG